MPAPFSQFRHLMRVQKRAITTNAAQEQVEEWSDWKSAYCRLTPQSANESQRGGGSGPIDADATHLIETWRIEDLKPDMRLVKADGRIFEIVSILNDDESDETMTIAAREAVM